MLHDMFAVPFDEIAPIVDRSPEAARQLASRARRRVRAEHTAPDADLDAQREVVDAFLAAARDGDFDGAGRGARPRRRAARRLRPGRPARARSAGRRRSPARRSCYSQLEPRHAAGARQRRRRARSPCATASRSRSAAFTVRGGRIVEIDFLADPERLRELDLTILDS